MTQQTAAVATAPTQDRALPVVIDAMGGDDAPAQVIAGSLLARDESKLDIVLVGRPDVLDDVDGLAVSAASEAIPMGADPTQSVRKLKDSSMVRCAEAVRDGNAAAMVSAGNTGAAMASALLRMGRIRGVARPAIAIPIPSRGTTPTMLLDAGANIDCQPEWLVQFGQMGAALARARYGTERPKVGLLSIGEEAGKGNQLAKDTSDLMAQPGWLDAVDAEFVGNVEGHDLLAADLDVVVADGFAGNVALKSLEGALRFVMEHVDAALAPDGRYPEIGEIAATTVHDLMDELHPDKRGGGILLGVRGVCVISHGSSSPEAIANALRLAREMSDLDIVSKLQTAIGR